MSDLSDRIPGINHLVVIRSKLVPFMVLGHCKRTILEFLDRIISVISFTAENSSKNVICFLDLSNNNGLEFATRSFKVEVRLFNLASILQTNHSRRQLTLCK